MKTRADILGGILQCTQMGQLGIRSVLDQNIRPALKKALVSQLREYDGIEKETLKLMQQRKIQPKNLPPVLPAGYRAITQARLLMGDKNSKIAAMMVNGNSRGMVTTLKNIHNFSQSDRKVLQLSQKLYETQMENIEQMKSFL